MIAFVDARRGISGTSLLAGLIDAGADVDAVADGVAGLGTGSKLRAEDVAVDGLRSCRVVVSRPDERMIERAADVPHLLSAGRVPPGAADRTADVYRRIAGAEARAHGVEPEAVRFEELATLRSVVGVVGSLLALEQLGVERVACSPLPFGGGIARTHHGRLPLPAPATLELLRGIPVEPQDEAGELVTPTGAALIATLAPGFGGIPPGTVEAIGVGTSNGTGTSIVTRIVLTSSERSSVSTTRSPDN